MALGQTNRSSFLAADRLALGRSESTFGPHRFLSAWIGPDYVWQFMVLLRNLEDLELRRQSPLVKTRRLLIYRRYRELGHFLGFSIPPHVFGAGLSIAHHGTIVVNKATRVGVNCRLHVCVNIGSAAGAEHSAPTIGDNVYIGPGAKIFGPINIADGCAIGANAVVNRSFNTPNRLIGGVPAKELGEVDTSSMLIRATEILASAAQPRE